MLFTPIVNGFTDGLLVGSVQDYGQISHLWKSTEFVVNRDTCRAQMMSYFTCYWIPIFLYLMMEYRLSLAIVFLSRPPSAFLTVILWKTFQTRAMKVLWVTRCCATPVHLYFSSSLPIILRHVKTTWWIVLHISNVRLDCKECLEFQAFEIAGNLWKLASATKTFCEILFYHWRQDTNMYISMTFVLIWIFIVLITKCSCLQFHRCMQKNGIVACMLHTSV